MAESPQEPGMELDLGTEDMTPLRTKIVEIHEMYEDLVATGFTKDEGLQIVAHIMYDVLASRFYDDDDDFDEEDDDEDGTTEQWAG